MTKFRSRTKTFERTVQAMNHDFYKIHGEPNCFAFHDVDLLPEDDFNLFSCFEHTAVHTCDKLNKYGYETQFKSNGKVSVGGSVLISKKHYESSNGHSNWFWGWGNEDIDAGDRLRNYLPIHPENDEFLKIEKESEYFKIIGEFMSDGLIRDGGKYDWGVFRQEKYGFMTQIVHKHGFTNGPAYSKLAVDNQFVTSMLKSNLRYFRKFRVGEHWSFTNSEKKEMKVLKTVPWDGVKTTGYTFKDIQYSRYFTKVTVDIRPGVIKRDVVTINSKNIYKVVLQKKSRRKKRSTRFNLKLAF